MEERVDPEDVCGVAKGELFVLLGVHVWDSFVDWLVFSHAVTGMLSNIRERGGMLRIRLIP